MTVLLNPEAATSTFQFYRSTIMTVHRQVSLFSCLLVSILQKYDYDLLLPFDLLYQIGFNSTEVRLWQFWNWMTIKCLVVSILQKYDYDLFCRGFKAKTNRFQFYRSTIMTLVRYLRGVGVAVFQFYRSTIMTRQVQFLLLCAPVSILQKYDYDGLECRSDRHILKFQFYRSTIMTCAALCTLASTHQTCFNSTEVRLWPDAQQLQNDILSFQFYRSTIMTSSHTCAALDV